VDDLRALSIMNPFAAMTVDGVKSIENRSRPFASKFIGQYLAIHASMKYSPCTDVPVEYARDGTHPSGAIIGLGYLENVLLRREMRDDNHAYAWGPYCLLFRDILKLEIPIQVPGCLGFWKVKAVAGTQTPRALAAASTKREAGVLLMKALSEGRFKWTAPQVSSSYLDSFVASATRYR
jgi:hypothetical protein